MRLASPGQAFGAGFGPALGPAAPDRDGSGRNDLRLVHHVLDVWKSA